MANSSCAGSNIRGIGSSIRVDGDNAMYGAQIISETYFSTNGANNELFIYINGTNFNSNLTNSIYCNSSDICKISCQSQYACSTFEIYCYGQCQIDCDFQNNGTECPNIIVGNYSEWTTYTPTFMPTLIPTVIPTVTPTLMPTAIPSEDPTTMVTSDYSYNTSGVHVNYNTTITDSNEETGNGNNGEIISEEIMIIIVVIGSLLVLVICITIGVIYCKRDRALKRQSTRETELASVGATNADLVPDINPSTKNNGNTMNGHVKTNGENIIIIGDDDRYRGTTVNTLEGKFIPGGGRVSEYQYGEDGNEGDHNVEELYGSGNMVGDTAGSSPGRATPGGSQIGDLNSNESNFAQWTDTEVLFWVKKVLAKSNFDNETIKQFVSEFSSKHVTGESLSQFKQNPKLLEQFQLGFNNKNQLFTIWVAISNGIKDIGYN